MRAVFFRKEGILLEVVGGSGYWRILCGVKMSMLTVLVVVWQSLDGMWVELFKDPDSTLVVPEFDLLSTGYIYKYFKYRYRYSKFIYLPYNKTVD